MKKKLWLLLADLDGEGIGAVLPSMAWIAEKAGALFECYLASERNGKLFARTGSTVLGGSHHQQLNYLLAIFDVVAFKLGGGGPFDSTLAVAGVPVIADAGSIGGLYRAALDMAGTAVPRGIALMPSCGDIVPYLYPEIFYSELLGFPSTYAEEAALLADGLGTGAAVFFGLEALEAAECRRRFPEASEPPVPVSWEEASIVVARRWVREAKGVAFGDPDAILSQIPRLCRERRVSVYGNAVPIAPADIVASAYTEETTSALEAVYELCEKTGNRVMVGRQTGDGDLFAWAEKGICLQIMDPNRPAFPVVEAVDHRWANRDGSWADKEADDAQLEHWAREGKVLASLIWHSGEMAHNEAMANLIELSSWTGLKMGIGAHVARYTSCPQHWELLSIPVEKGGARGRIEPMLHTGGWGIMGESRCPPELLRDHCRTALAEIKRIAGTAGLPRGYYAFMDSDMATFTEFDPALVRAAEESGLEYYVTNAFPGRNRALYRNDRMIAVNQSSRSIATGSPYVRITDVEDILHYTPAVAPGWFLGVLDSPVIAFSPYIWREGSRFMRIVDCLVSSGRFVNVLPYTVARYARVLEQLGYLPAAKEGKL